ncbi:Membrane protein involved in the export of O-antigen and teichoic acid [Flavobacterium segetis]|uniref:Membrane protein involved in the export of O-antigen and teichoic acid n=1 Tax=Flavobacterium segetis TaxID=271157 RepID=A0A1M5IFU4_9FLAO|nr:polysaccharide biosynthesis C-terminal domain-containing protein [Flavobacterium segetis]SHG27106.1 Membrane protein involved in the export of O-antigen and teichoic acid [Flavobacterium segetis]
MSTIIKESLKTSGINYIGILFGAFFTLYLTPKFLPTEYNGLYRLLLEYSGIAAVYFHFGIPTLINKYYHRIHFEFSVTKGFDFFVFVFPLIFLFIFGGFLNFFRSEATNMITSKNDYGLVVRYVSFLTPLIICNAYFFIFEAYSAMLGKIAFVNFFKNIILKIFNIISILLYILTKDFDTIMIIVSSGYILSTLIVFFYLLKLKKYKIDLRPSLDFLKQNSLLRDFLKFFLFLCLSNLTFFLLSKIDIFFVAKFTSMSNLAYYSTATYFVTLLLVPYAAVLNISFPRIAKSFTGGNLGELKSLIVTNSIYGFVLALYVFIIIWSNLDTIYIYIPNGNLYKAGKYIFLILSIGKLIDISIGSIGQVITISKWYFYTLYSSVAISIISVFLGYYLTSRFGITGAASSLSICTVLSVVFQLSVAKYKIGIHPYTNKILIIIFLALFLVLLCSTIDYIVHSLIIATFIKIILSTLLYFYAVYRFKISNEIAYILDRVLRPVLNRSKNN